MTHASRMHQNGGPEVLVWEEVTVPPPAAGEATVQQHAVGLNFIDIYHRTGLYPLTLPSGIGLEGAGLVTAVGPGVSVSTVPSSCGVKAVLTTPVVASKATTYGRL